MVGRVCDTMKSGRVERGRLIVGDFAHVSVVIPLTQLDA